MQRISVVIITKNEERNIGRCITSVRWADEVIVVDAQSTDRTAELAVSLGARVIERAWQGFALQKEFAVAQARNEWVLSMDADEESTEELRTEILRVTDNGGDGSPAGYRIPRKSFFLGRWIRYGGWYPGWQMRLFKRSSARMNHRPVHEGFEIDGAIGTLTSALNHYTYDSLHQYLEKMNDYTSLDVMNKLSERPDAVIRWYHCVLNPIALFLRMFISLKGYRDGMEGFLLAVYSSLYKLLVYAKSWEYQRARKHDAELPPVGSEDLLAIKRLRSS
ncbi:MAG: glycosyltransferase family 2 protein [Acidobacteriota bacterium]